MGDLIPSRKFVLTVLEDRSFWDRMLAWLFRKMNSADAEDLIAEIWTNLLAAPEKFHSIKSVQGWSWKAASMRVRNCRRTFHPLDEDIVDDHAQDFEQVDAQDLHEVIRAKLDQDDYDILFLRVCAEMELKDIAPLFDYSGPSGVSRRIKQIMITLRSALDDQT